MAGKIDQALKTGLSERQVVAYLEEKGDVLPGERKWFWIAGLTLQPPLVGYVVFFYVARWVYRGFSSSSMTT